MPSSSGSPGRPRGDGPIVRVPVRFPVALLAKVEAAAKKDGRSRDEWIRRALAAMVKP